MLNNFKNCSKCCENLPLLSFYKDKTNKDGYCSQCKRCKNENIKKMRLNRMNQNIQKPINKICPKCKLNLCSSNFTSLKSSKDGLAVYCKKCRRLNDTNRRNNSKENPIIIDDKYSIIKKCTKCLIDKDLSFYRINRKSSDNFTHICVDCLPKNNWTREKQQISEKKYRLNNPEKIKEKFKKYSSSINYRIRQSIHSRLVELLFKDKISKKNKTFTYIGCDINYFKKWLECQFVDGMTWNNYGEWHLDHVKPCSSYNLTNETEIKECFNWKNYQPLWKKDNMSKSNKININYIEQHKEKAYIFEMNNISILYAQVKEGELLETP